MGENMINCFTFTYKYLKNNGVYVPKEWKQYTQKDMKRFILDYQYFLNNRIHYDFFESFCEYVNEAQENDIIIDDFGVGVAINKFKYITIKEKNSKSFLYDIEKHQKILRVKNG